MGTPKPLLPWNGTPLVKRLAEVHCWPEAQAESLWSLRRARRGPPSHVWGWRRYQFDAERGMLSSVHVGLTALGEGPFLVCPCDLPRLTDSHVRAILSAWDGSDAQIVAPSRSGKRGHPTLFGKNYWQKALELDPELVGLNELLKNYPITEITIDDEGPFRDADTPDDWARLLAQE